MHRNILPHALSFLRLRSGGIEFDPLVPLAASSATLLRGAVPYILTWHPPWHRARFAVKVYTVLQQFGSTMRFVTKLRLWPHIPILLADVKLIAHGFDVLLDLHEVTIASPADHSRASFEQLCKELIDFLLSLPHLRRFRGVTIHDPTFQPFRFLTFSRWPVSQLRRLLAAAIDRGNEEFLLSALLMVLPNANSLEGQEMVVSLLRNEFETPAGGGAVALQSLTTDSLCAILGAVTSSVVLASELIVPMSSTPALATALVGFLVDHIFVDERTAAGYSAGVLQTATDCLFQLAAMMKQPDDGDAIALLREFFRSPSRMWVADQMVAVISITVEELNRACPDLSSSAHHGLIMIDGVRVDRRGTGMFADPDRYHVWRRPCDKVFDRLFAFCRYLLRAPDLHSVDPVPWLKDGHVEVLGTVVFDLCSRYCHCSELPPSPHVVLYLTTLLALRAPVSMQTDAFGRLVECIQSVGGELSARRTATVHEMGRAVKQQVDEDRDVSLFVLLRDISVGLSDFISRINAQWPTLTPTQQRENARAITSCLWSIAPLWRTFGSSIKGTSASVMRESEEVVDELLDMVNPILDARILWLFPDDHEDAHLGADSPQQSRRRERSENSPASDYDPYQERKLREQALQGFHDIIADNQVLEALCCWTSDEDVKADIRSLVFV